MSELSEGLLVGEFSFDVLLATFVFVTGGK
jgi:hypothetical protein